MDLSDILKKDSRIFSRDDYTCVACNSEGDYDSLWAASFGDENIRRTVCTSCVQNIIKLNFEESERKPNNNRNLSEDNVGLQTERYLDETFAYVFRWLFWFPFRFLKVVFAVMAAPFFWLGYIILNAIRETREQYREGYQSSMSEVKSD